MSKQDKITHAIYFIAQDNDQYDYDVVAQKVSTNPRLPGI